MGQNRWVDAVRKLPKDIRVNGGFGHVKLGNTSGWQDLVHPWPGEFRVIRGVRAQGMRHWRHATARELSAWLLANPQTCDPRRPSIIACGTLYRGGPANDIFTPDEVAQVGFWSTTKGPAVTLTTHRVDVARPAKPSDLLKYVLGNFPDTEVLCVIPRG